MYCKACTKLLPSTSRDSTQQNERGFAVSPIDTATWAQQNKRGLAASPIDMATPEDKQKLETRLCSFPHRHGDGRRQAETRDEIRFAASTIDTATWAQQHKRGFAASSTDTELTTQKKRRKNDAKMKRKRHDEQLEADKGPAPRPPDYKREPFRYAVYYKACTKHFPVLLCITNIAQTRSQYYCVLQSLHKYVPSTTVYYKHCTNTFPVLLGTAKLAEKSFPVLLCTTKQCTDTFPVLLCTTKLAESTS